MSRFKPGIPSDAFGGPFIMDSFGGAQGKLTESAGSSWKIHPSSYCGTNLLTLSGFGSIFNNTGGYARGMAFSAARPTTPDYSVCATLVCFESVTSVNDESYDGIAFRWSSTEATGYILYLVSPSHQFELYRVNNGRLTLLAESLPYKMVEGTPQVVDITVQGSNILCRLNSGSMTGRLGKVVEDPIPLLDAGVVGLVAVAKYASSITGGVHWTNFVAYGQGVVQTPSGISLNAPGEVFGVAGVQSGDFTVAPTGGGFVGTIVPLDNGSNGIFTPSKLSWHGTNTPQTFKYTALAGGRKTISVSSLPLLQQPPPVVYPVISAWVGVSGETLTVSFGSDYDDPIVLSAPGPLPTLRIVGRDEVILTSFPIVCYPNFEGTSAPHVIYQLKSKVAANDVVSITLAYGAIITSVGKCPAVVDGVCNNYSGGTFPLDVAPTRNHTMRLGNQWFGGDFFEPLSIYANKARTASSNWSDSTGTAYGFACGGFDQEGMPVASGGNYGKTIIDPMDAPELPGGYAHAACGLHTVLWDGQGNSEIANTPDDPQLRQLTSTTNNIRVYDDIPAAPGKLSPRIILGIDKTGNKDVRNIRIFDKYITDVYNPPKFHPLVMEKLVGTKVNRAKDSFGIDGGCPISEFSDHTPSTTLSILDRRQDGRVGITRFDPYSNGPYVRDGEQGIKVTCVDQHRLQPGQFVSLYFPSEGHPWPFMLKITHADSVVEDVSWNSVMAYPISPTEFVVNGWFTSPILPLELPLGSQVWKKWAGSPVEDIVDQTNELYDCDLWVSLPHACTNQYVKDLLTFICNRLAPGRRLYVEYTNEPWNGDAAYPQYNHIRLMAREFALAKPGNTFWNTTDDVRARRYYVMTAGRLFDIARTTWVANGRLAGDISLVLNAQLCNTQRVLEFANDADNTDINGNQPGHENFVGKIIFTGFAVATYMSINPYAKGSLTDEQYDSITNDQLMDIGDTNALNIRCMADGQSLKAHATAIEALARSGRPGIQLLSYESGPSLMGMGGTTHNAYQRTIVWSKSPRATSQYAARLEMLNEVGIVVCVKNGPFGTYVLEGGRGHCYSTFTGLEQTVSPVNEAIQNWNKTL